MYSGEKKYKKHVRLSEINDVTAEMSLSGESPMYNYVLYLHIGMDSTSLHMEFIYEL